VKVQARVAQQPQPSPSSSGPKPALGSAKTQAPRDAFASPATGAGGNVQSAFRQQFGALAADPKKFHDTMKMVYGDGYDAKAAEGFRQKALAGDFSWLPPVKWVSSQTLQGNHGAYDAGSGTVFLNADLKNNPALAASTYVEEAGHHLDTKLNTKDAVGDEGEMFRRVLSGEKLTAAQIADIRADDDHGTITVDGRQVQVEFWNPFKAIGDAAKAVGGAVVGAVKAVGNAVVDVGKGVIGGVKDVVSGIGEGVGGFFGNLVQGHFGDALGSLVNGVDKAFFQAPQRVVSGLFDGAGDLLHGFSPLLGPLGKPVDWVGTRLLDAGRTLADTGFGISRDLFRMGTEPAVGFVQDMEKTVKLLGQGKFGDAAKQFGMSFVHVPERVIGGAVDVVMRGVQGGANALLTALGIEQPTRALRDNEIQTLKQIYGDAIDYDVVRVKDGGVTDWLGMAAHVVGNTVYLPSSNFNADGTLNAEGMDTLMHEAGHVWQNQNGGGDYIHKALLAQTIASISGGSRNGAYDWRQALDGGTPFNELNPEEQAQLGRDIGRALQDDGQVTARDFSPALTGSELAYVLDAWNKFKRGEGAP